MNAQITWYGIEKYEAEVAPGGGVEGRDKSRPLLKRVKPEQRQEAFGAQSTQVVTETDIGEVATKATQ